MTAPTSSPTFSPTHLNCLVQIQVDIDCDVFPSSGDSYLEQSIAGVLKQLNRYRWFEINYDWEDDSSNFNSVGPNPSICRQQTTEVQIPCPSWCLGLSTTTQEYVLSLIGLLNNTAPQGIFIPGTSNAIVSPPLTACSPPVINIYDEDEIVLDAGTCGSPTTTTTTTTTSSSSGGSSTTTTTYTPLGQYVDAGATCTDVVEGNLDANVVTSGDDEVDTAKVGRYWVVYNCKNQFNIPAVPKTRTVWVVDNCCPTCTVTDGTGPTEIEASFPYDDAGATCVDNIDASADVVITSTNDVNVEATGTYYVTYRGLDSGKNYNDGTKSVNGTCKNGAPTIRTVVVIDTLRPIIGLKYNNEVINIGSGHYDHTDHKSALTAAAIDAAQTHPFSVGAEVGTPHPEETVGALMEEKAASGYGMLALASGTAGLLLLGIASRRSAPSLPISV